MSTQIVASTPPGAVHCRRRRAYVHRMHFAYMQAKCFARHFLQNLTVTLEPGSTPDWAMWPIPSRATDCAW